MTIWHDDEPDPGSDDDDDTVEGADADDVEACPSCGRPVYADADACPRCGHFLHGADAPPARRSTWFVVAAVLCLIAMLATIGVKMW